MENQQDLMWVRFHVQIICGIPLKELATNISNRLLGGIEFVETSIYDEVPCMQLSKDIFGLRILLFGFGKSDGFEFNARPTMWTSSASSQDLTIPVVDFSSYLVRVLEQIVDAKVTVMEYPR